jgi:AcrR family transcriptional regulator
MQAGRGGPLDVRGQFPAEIHRVLHAKRTLFAYFPSKDDLILHRFADHEDETARVVRQRSPGEAPLDALHRHLRSALGRCEPTSGLCDDPDVVAFYGSSSRPPR